MAMKALFQRRLLLVQSNVLLGLGLILMDSQSPRLISLRECPGYCDFDLVVAVYSLQVGPAVI